MNRRESPPDDSRRAAWSAYWAQGALHSCVGSFDASYTGAIGDFWRSAFAGIRQGARVLDLATGNGSLPLQLWESQGSAAGLRIDAVDLAALAPRWYHEETHRGIAFHSGVAMEHLPFGDASFDCVVSQFGFEYAQRDLALQELLRVSRPSGTIALVMHHADSVLVRVGRSELANHHLLLAPDGPIATARDVLPWIARARGGADLRSDPAATEARNRYNAAMVRVQEAGASSDVPDLLVEARARVHRLLARVDAAGADAARKALDDYAQALREAVLRTGEMISHALDRRQADAIASAIKSARPRADVRCEPLRQAQGTLAWGLHAAQA